MSQEATPKRIRRSALEIQAEREADLARVRAKAALEAAKQNEELAPLFQTLAELKKELRKAKVILGSGPQSAAARIQKHKDWIQKIQAELNWAEEAQTELADNIQSLEDNIQAEALNL